MLKEISGKVLLVPLAFLEEVGNITRLALYVLYWTVRPPYRFGQLLTALSFIGVGSIFIVGLTGVFTGGVLALQSYQGFRSFRAEGMVGAMVGLALTRELGPVFSALMVSSRAGSAMATELGTMRVTDQIDAMATMAVNPVQYLIVPRVLATTIILPALAMLFNIVGMLGAWLVSVYLLDIDPGVFISRLRYLVEPDDLFGGLFKAAVFGFILSIIACYKGYYASGGAAGVGQATTKAVVYSAVSILVVDYFLTSLML